MIKKIIINTLIFSRRLRMGIGFLLNHKAFLAQQSYYDCSNRKSDFRIITEMFIHILKHGEINRFYFAYGLDQKGCKSEEYMAYSDFMDERNRMNCTRPFDYRCILGNKNIFGIVAEAFKMPTPSNIGILCNGLFTFHQDNVNEDNLWDGTDSLFLKAISGECGQNVLNVKKCENRGGYLLNNSLFQTWSDIKDYFKSEEFRNIEFVVQKCLRNHPVIDSIYPTSINTIRLVTVKNPKSKQAEPLAAVLRLGAHGHPVDNWAMGGLAVKVNDDGTLASEGYYKPGYGTKTKIHPDTHVAFDKIKLPFYDECMDLCCMFHNKLAIHSIGWDVALTPEGPVIIEGNDNWEISIMQVACGPLRNKFINTL